MDFVNMAEGELPAKLTNLTCCRACLATEDKLFNICEYKLAGEFFRVTGIIVTENDKQPQHLCVWCAAVMKRSAAFRAKCLRAEQCLQLFEGEVLTTESVHTIDRLANRLADLHSTEVEIVSIDSQVIPDVEPMPIVNITETLDVRNIVCETVKKELNVDSLIEQIKVKAAKNEIDVAEDRGCDDFQNVKSESDNETTKHKNDFIEVQISRIIKRKAASKSEIRTKRQRKKKKLVATKGKGKKIVKKRTAEDDYMPKEKMEEFQNAYDVEIVSLTFEEQVAEIEARRDTEEFKTAEFPCDPCGKYFRLEGAYNLHKVRHAAEAGPHECPVCKLRFPCRTSHLTHYDYHRVKLVCRQCGFVSRVRSQAKLHHAWHAGKRYKCKYCEKDFSKRSTYLGHVRQVHKVLNVVCNMCGETFVNTAGLKMHRVYAHGVAKQKEYKVMECKTCSVTFVSLAALNKHKMAAGEHDKMAACAQCGDTYDTEDGLKGHVEAEHPRCQECNSTFLNVKSFNIHIARKHLGKGCGRNDKIKELNNRARALGLPLPFPPPKPKTSTAAKENSRVCCELCGRMFQNPTMLNYHLRKHRGEKLPFACAHCPKTFSSNHQLEDHTRIHTGDKPFKCDQCDLAFTLKSNLTRHVRCVHLGIRRTTECNICGHYFATPFTMKMHVRTVHNGEPWPKRAPRKKKQKEYARPVETEET